MPFKPVPYFTIRVDPSGSGLKAGASSRSKHIDRCTVHGVNGVMAPLHRRGFPWGKLAIPKYGDWLQAAIIP